MGGKGYLPWMRGGTYLGWGGGEEEAVPTLDQGVHTLDRLCRERYASCGFPQEDILVLN